MRCVNLESITYLYQSSISILMLLYLMIHKFIINEVYAFILYKIEDFRILSIN